MNPQNNENDLSPQGQDPSLRAVGLESLRSHPSRTYLVLFFVLISASLLIYAAVQSGSRPGAVLLLLVLILTNLVTLIF